MGQDTALLPISGEPLAARTARVLTEAGCQPVSVVGNQPALARLGWTVLREPDGPHHPLRGVGAALDGLTGGCALFAPCDLPSLTPAAVAMLLAHGGPCRAQGQHLLCILPSERAAEAAEAARAGASVRSFVADLDVISLSESVLLNANCPEDLPRNR